MFSSLLSLLTGRDASSQSDSLRTQSALRAVGLWPPPDKKS
jgi:hypothetical protein